MSAVVQHKSIAFSGNVGSLAFDSPVTKGNLIVVGMVAVQGETTVFTPDMMSDGHNTYAIATQFNDTSEAQNKVLGIFSTVAGASGALTVSFNDPAGAPFNALHIYEVSGGYRLVDQTGAWTNSSGVSSSHVSTDVSTAFSNEFVLALFFGSSSGAGNVAWTPQAGTDATETTNVGTGSISTFSEAFEVSSLGRVTANVSINGGGSYFIPTAVIATFANAYTISGNAGVSGATVTLSGDASRSTTAFDGTYSFSVAAGHYVVSPSLSGQAFTPSSRNEIVTIADITNVDFTAVIAAATQQAIYQQYAGPNTSSLSTLLSTTFANRGQQDLLQVVDSSGNVVFHINSVGGTDGTPTPTAVIGRFETRSGSDVPSYLASVFLNPDNLDIIQVVQPGSHVAFWVDYQGNVIANGVA